MPAFKNDSPDPTPARLHRSPLPYAGPHTPRGATWRKSRDKKGERTISRNLDHEWLCVWRGVVGGMFCPVRTGTSSPGTPSWPLGPALCSRQSAAGSLAQVPFPLSAGPCFFWTAYLYQLTHLLASISYLPAVLSKQQQRAGWGQLSPGHPTASTYQQSAPPLPSPLLLQLPSNYPYSCVNPSAPTVHTIRPASARKHLWNWEIRSVPDPPPPPPPTVPPTSSQQSACQSCDNQQIIAFL